MTHKPAPHQKPRWLYPLVYVGLLLLTLLPLYTALPYDPRDTQDVIFGILMVSVEPYRAWAPLFHLAFLVLVALIALRPARMGRVLAAYMGLNYLVIGLVQTHATTEQYGFALHTGALVANLLLAAIWIVVAIRGEIEASLAGTRLVHWLLLPLALLAFWAPYSSQGAAVVPNWDPRLLLTSPDFGLTYCLTTPVFLFLLILFYPRVNEFAYKVTAFNGLLYGLYNLTHWFSPERWWMGLLHLPLLLLSAYALILPRLRPAAALL